ncbi:MAG: family tricarboxylate transporter, receptor protein [Hyphomicrobiales bacterium]|nr:family tricarboxylate transporter, receptor protein [Hyphomicrobiales bacterium]
MRLPVFVAASLCLLGFPALAQEQNWPNRQIQIIVPLPAGSAADTVARLFGQKLSERFGRSIIIINRDGASGAIGTREIVSAKPDGYTLGIATSTTLVTAPILNKNAGYDTMKDFTHVAMVGYSPYVLVTHPGVPAKSVAEFVSLAKAKPDTVTYTSVGDASLARLGAELLSQMSNIRIVQVPYKSSTQAVMDVLNGRVDSQFGILTTTHQYIQDGKLNALGVTTAKRVPEFPDIPTIAESGLPGFEATLWVGLIAPAGLPESIKMKLNQAVNELLNSDETRKPLFNQAIFADPMSAQDYSKFIAADLARWSDLARKAGLVH